MRKKTILLFVFTFIVGLSFVSNTINNDSILNNNLVSAVTEQFDMKDTFETQINNRIYTEYGNYTNLEYFRDNISDEAHFTEDKEDFITNGIDEGISDSNFNWIATADLHGLWSSYLNITDFPYMKIRIWMNVSTEYFYVNLRDSGNGHIVNLDYWNVPSNTWIVLNVTIPIIYREQTKYIFFRFHTPHSVYPVYVKTDYVKLFNSTISETDCFKMQDTTYNRAYRGMKSYVSNVSSLYRNNSIKIDVPSLEFFPEKIKFAIYSSTYYNLTFNIGSFSEILYQNNLYINSWIFISKSIHRYDYLLNDTADIVYFEINYNTSETFSIFYIDELTITYTEPQQIFTNVFNTGRGTHLDGFNYNTTNNYFHATPSGEYPYSFGNDSLGIVYETHSNNLYSKRMFLDYTLLCNEVGVSHRVIQEIRISLDKEYVLRTEFTNSPYSYSDFYNRLVWLKHYLYIDGELVRNYYSGTVNDFIIDGFNDFDLNVRFQQEDYNTMSIICIYNNKITGNTTSFEPFAFKVNDGDIKNSLTKMNVSSYIKMIPATIGFTFPTVFYHSSNPTITGKITRDIKHSPMDDSNPTVNLPVKPVWRGGIYALADIWNFIVYFVTIFIQQLIEFFKQSMYLRDIVKNIGDFFSGFVTHMTNIFNIMGDMLVALGEITSVGDFISVVLDTIWSLVENLFDTLVGIVADMISALGDIIDGDLLGFPIIDDILDAWEAFVLRDWATFKVAWENIIPELSEDTIGFVLFIPDWFLSLWLDDTQFLSTLIINGLKIVKEIWFWMTILIIMYMVYFMQLIIKRDFDRIRIEVTTMVNIVNWIIDSIVFVFHWIFEFLHAVLDVTIPFT